MQKATPLLRNYPATYHFGQRRTIRFQHVGYFMQEKSLQLLAQVRGSLTNFSGGLRMEYYGGWILWASSGHLDDGLTKLGLARPLVSDIHSGLKRSFAEYSVGCKEAPNA